MTNSYFSIWGILDAYKHMLGKRDKRVDGFYLMSSPFPVLIICAVYIHFIKYLGPRLMRDRRPFELKGLIIFYNIIQFLLNTFLVFKFLKHAWLWRYSFRCQPVDSNSDDPDDLEMIKMCHLYFLVKLSEFLETVFFVLRKKSNQITHLHVIHHNVMAICSWGGTRFLPGGHGTFFGPVNSFVHLLSYVYYLISAMGPEYQQYIWWKKYLTSIQMIQFAIVFIHTMQLFFIECDYPLFIGYLQGSLGILFIVLFLNFYIQSYMKKDRRARRSDKRSKSAMETNEHSRKENAEVIDQSKHAHLRLGDSSSENLPTMRKNKLIESTLENSKIL